MTTTSSPSDLFKSPIAIPDGIADDVQMPASALCPGTLPLVLLPVRLETRFFPLPDGGADLRIRVYPDKIHLDSHEPELTTEEQAWGQHYWVQDWHAGNVQALRADAWRQLADRFGAARAAWIARMTRPSNDAQRPAAAVPADQPLPAAPVFPALALAEGSEAWRRAPQARLLPDRWLAVLHSGGKVVQTANSKDVQRPLHVGPDPKAPPLSDTEQAEVRAGERLAIDDGMKWMVDFEAAEAAGMALRMPVTPAQLATGLDSLVVFGVAGSASGADVSTQLADLLDAHHYTDGLAFLRAGTPTNNSDDRRTDYRSNDPGQQRSFAIEAATAPATGATNAATVGRALGLPVNRIDATLGRIDRGTARDDLDMRSMNTALWQVGWGYFLGNMIGSEAGLTPEAIEWSRRHFLDHVRSFGPLPTLRCGPQPYGLLPVTSLDLWQPGPDETDKAEGSWLTGLLKSLREGVWRPAAQATARIGRRQNPPDPDADLADVMCSDAVSGSYAARPVFGRHFLQHLHRLVASSLADEDPAQVRLLQQLGIGWRPRLAHLWNAGWRWPVSAPLVQAGEVSPWAPLAPNYIADLLAERQIAKLIEMRPAADAVDRATPMLKMLLRHALLREIAQAAARLLSSEARLLRDDELVDLVAGAPKTMHWLAQLGEPAPGGGTIRDQLEHATDFSAPALAALGDFRAGLAHLQGLDSEALQLLAQGTLDLSAHRLDAWVTSVASKRLAAMRGASPSGACIGAYGWVENLKPLPTGRTSPVVSLPMGEPGPLLAFTNDSGFIHAPSPTHAAAAALLRNAHLGPPRAQPLSAASPFAIDLSSRRVREADRLLDGLRQGQPLAALLGYRFERILHDTVVAGNVGLDRFIAPLRRLAPLVVRADPAAAGPVEHIAANNVVDGLVLLRRWKEENAVVMQVLRTQSPAPGDAELAALSAAFDQLADAVDGLSDALTAEAAYQVVRGNTSRLASTLSAISEGAAPPPELEVARTPRSGTALTHRMMVLMSGVTNLDTPGWLQADKSSRSNSERLLNYWAAKLLGNAAQVRCTVERLDDTGAVAETGRFALSELSISALDMVYGVEAANSSGAGDGASEVEQRVLYWARRRPGGFAPGARLRLQHARPADLAAGELTLFDLLEQARAVRRLLSAARGARPEDMGPPERGLPATVDLLELQTRTIHAEDALNAAHKNLLALLAQPAPTGEALRAGLLALGVFGVGPSIPVSAAGEEPAAIGALANQARALTQLSKARIDQFAELRRRPAATEPRARCDQFVERMRAVFGPSFVVLPRITLDAAGAAELGNALAASVPAQGGDPLAANTWFLRQARVRDPLARLGACLQRAEVQGAGARLNLNVAQLPFVAGERWVGLPAADQQEAPHGKLSLVLQTLGPISPAQALTGLLVDEWVEVIPSRQETTALAFQFDLPNSCAPQSVLIAVPPVPGKDWTAETLRKVLMETLDLAKLRGVDTASLGAAAQHLPGLYLAFNAADHAVSTDFHPLTA